MFTGLLVVASLALSPTPSSALPPVQTDAFGVHWYPGPRGPVVAVTRHDVLTVRAPADTSVDALSRVAEDALVGAKSEHLVALDGPVTRQVEHGLFVVELTDALTDAAFRAFAAELERSPLVTKVHAVLGRSTGRVFVDERLVVLAEPDQRDAVVQAVLSKVDGKLLRNSLLPGAALIEVGAAVDHSAVRAAQRLTHDGVPGLLAAEPQLYRELEPLQLSDPDYPEQWHLGRHPNATIDVPGSATINITGAWAVTNGSPEVLVAVLDSGIEHDHPDLAANVVGGIDAVDNDGDPSPACTGSPNNTEASDDCPANLPYLDAHGTSVSGLITAVGDNAVGGVGICPSCALLPVRFLAAGFNKSLTNAETFVRVVDEGADVINNSWGPGGSIFFPLSLSLATAFEIARTEGRDGLGTVIVFAAGNETLDVSLNAYGAHPDTLAIAASTSLDDWASYSDYGAQIDLAAPSRGEINGVDTAGLVCADVTGDNGYEPGDITFGFGGTSGASPIAAGVAALVIAANPELTSAQVRLAMTATADKIIADKIDWEDLTGQDLTQLFAYDNIGHSIAFGFGRVNAGLAVAAAAQMSQLGAVCDEATCAGCDVYDRCLTACDEQADCADGAICRGGLCTLPVELPEAIGGRCTANCPVCVDAIDTEGMPTDVCSDVCSEQSDCPLGFDCRTVDADGLAVCVSGDPQAGEAYDLSNCRNAFYGVRIVAEGDSGERYCSDLCLSDALGSCPYGFHCGAASCECIQESPFGCRVYECAENSLGNTNWGTPMCFPNEGFGVFCNADIDCGTGDYCGPDNLCRLDDRETCDTCKECSSDADCGEGGVCFGDPNNGPGRCTRTCADDEDCAGDGVCRLVEVGRCQGGRTCHGSEAFFVQGSEAICTSPGQLEGASICTDDFVCEVTCRDDVPCPYGQVCEDSACVPAPFTEGEVVYLDWEEQPDAEPDQVVGTPSCRCAPAPADGWPVGLLGLLGLGGALLPRRRRRCADFVG